MKQENVIKCFMEPPETPERKNWPGGKHLLKGANKIFTMLIKVAGILTQISSIDSATAGFSLNKAP